ncbi:phage holin family protein [Cedecea sp.]|jgi:hypothetical protein|uniref:phage holin family protein n=1 Tax=Cedecea sp. TaxID=1970739 RepID=UPI002F40CAA2
MQEYEKWGVSLAILGALIALGKMLDSGEPVTVRLVAGRVIVGSALALMAGSVLYLRPDTHPLAIVGLASALGITGHSLVEAWLKKKAKQSLKREGK